MHAGARLERLGVRALDLFDRLFKLFAKVVVAVADQREALRAACIRTAGFGNFGQRCRLQMRERSARSLQQFFTRFCSEHDQLGLRRCVQHLHLRDFRETEEHTSELQSLMRISYAVFCWKKKTNRTYTNVTRT